MSTWLEETLERNLSPRAEEIIAEIHGVQHEEVEDIADTNLTLAQVAGAVMTGELGKEFERVWEIK